MKRLVFALALLASPAAQAAFPATGAPARALMAALEGVGFPVTTIDGQRTVESPRDAGILCQWWGNTSRPTDDVSCRYSRWGHGETYGLTPSLPLANALVAIVGAEDLEREGTFTSSMPITCVDDGADVRCTALEE